MAKIKFPRKEFEKEIKITPAIEEKINMFGTHLESLTDEEIELEILPNRPDLFSFQGFLRSFKSFLGKEPGLKKYRINPPESNYKVKIDKSVAAVRPYTACAIVKGLKFDDSKIKQIIDLQEKIHTTLGRNRKKLAIGIYPLEKIKLPIKFEARKPQEIRFMPLESDREMTGLEILQRHPTGRDYAKLLEGYDKFPVFVDANNKILSMPPIINSHETGKITQQTKDVFIECSGFDLQILKKTLNIIVTTLSEMSGKIYAMHLEYDKPITTPDLTPETMKISVENTNKLLGLNLTEKDIEKLLPKMGYDYKSGKASIPAWRTDILHECDIIEDIAISYGYEKITPQIPNVATPGEESKTSKLKSKIAEILIGLKLLEISTYHLIKLDEIEKGDDKIELKDSKTDYKLLRPNLIIPALRIISENKDNEYPQRIFELGKVFKKRATMETGIEEHESLCVARTPSNFTDVKQILDYLMKMIDLPYTLEESEEKYLIPGRTALIKSAGKEIGTIGEVHPETLLKWGMKLPIALIEINLDLI